MRTDRRPRPSLLPKLLRALAMLAGLATSPALAQESWHNPYTGRNWNNPGSSLIDSFLQNDARRRMLMQPGGMPATRPGAAASPQPFAAGADPSFRVINRGPATIRELYVSSSQLDQWGPDRLGQNLLGAGQAVVVRLPAGLCLNDLRAVFVDGRVLERHGVDTCGILDLPLP